MSFGLTDDQTIFIDLIKHVQTLIRSVHDSIYRCFVCSRLKAEQEDHSRTVLRVLQKRKLYAKFFKYEFWLNYVPFLGRIISYKGMGIDS